MNVFDLVATLRLDSTQYENELSGARDTAEKGGKGISGALGTAGKVAAGAMAAAGTAAVAFAKSSVDAGMTFDKSMSQVAATMGYTVDEINTEGSEANRTFQTLNEFAKEMGRTTAFSASEAADALNYMALAGYNADTSMDMLPAVLDLAAAGNVGLARASDMVTDAQSALGLELDDTKLMVNQMAAASSKTNTSVEQLGDAFLTIGATARSVRGGTTELATVLGVLADNGIKGSEGGTHLRNMILSLQDPTEEAAMIMERLGIKVYDSQGNMRSMIDIVGDLQEATKDMDNASRDAVVNGMFKLTDVAAVNALLGTSIERFDELEVAISGAWYTSGSLDKSLKELDSATSFDNLMHAFEGIGVSAEDVEEALKLSKGDATDFVNTIWEWSDAGVSFDDVLAALGVSVDDLQDAFDGATGAASEMANTQLDNLAGDVTLWKSALEGAQIAISDKLAPILRDFVQTATTGITELTSAFTEGGLTGVLDTISGWITEKSPLLGIAFDTVRETVSTAFTTIKEVWESVLLPALQAFHDFVNNTLAPIIQNVIDTIIKPAFERFGESVRTVWENIIKPAFDALRTFVVETLAPAITTAWQETIQPAIETVSTAIQTAWENVIKPAFEALWKFTTETLAPKIKEAWETTIQPTIEAVGNIIQSVWENIIKPAWEAMQKLVGETLAPKIKEAWETTIKPAVETVGKAIETIWTNTIKPAWDNMNTRMNEVAANLKGAWETTIQPAIETVGKAIETIWTNTIKPAIEAFSKFTTETLAPAIKDAWENLIQPTIEGVGKIIQATWEGVIKPAWDAMKTLVIDTLAPKIKEAWETIIKPAIETVGKIIEEIWTNTIRPAWEAMNSKMGEVAAAISDAWNTIIQPAIETVASAISAAWTNVIQPAWQAISDAVGVLGSTVQSVWTTVIQPAVETVGGIISGVWTGVIQPAWQGLLDSLGVISQNFNEFLSTATTIWNGVRDAIVSPIQTAEAWIGEIVGRLKGIFNFEWSLPKLKMPHFTIDWVDIGGIISLPSITVEWYRKAYDNPFMFNSPTMMGFGDGVGGEMVYGHESLMNDIKSAVQQVVGIQEENDRPIVVQCVLDGRIISESVATYQSRRARAFG